MEVTRGWKICIVKLYRLYSSPSVVRVIKSRRMIGAERKVYLRGSKWWGARRTTIFHFEGVE
jgi:hypothetical protein